MYCCECFKFYEKMNLNVCSFRIKNRVSLPIAANQKIPKENGKNNNVPRKVQNGALENREKATVLQNQIVVILLLIFASARAVVIEKWIV